MRLVCSRIFFFRSCCFSAIGGALYPFFLFATLLAKDDDDDGWSMHDDNEGAQGKTWCGMM